jgi:hypothetical protein
MFSLVLLLGVCSFLHGNEAALPPKPTGSAPLANGPKEAPLVIEVNEHTKVPWLQIPRKLLGTPPASERKGAALGGDRLPITMAGLALTAAVIAGGLWLVRRGQMRRAAGLGLGLGLALCVGGATALWADLPPRPRGRPAERIPPVVPPALVLPAAIQFDKQIVIEIVDKGDAIKLTVHKNMVGKLANDKPEVKAPPKE